MFRLNSPYDVRVIFLVLLVTAVIIFVVIDKFYSVKSITWDDKEIQILKSLSLNNLPEIRKDLSNRVEESELAAKLGQQLFFDKRLSSNGEVACSTCHQPKKYFTDGLPFAKGVSTGNRNTMTVVGAAYSPWQFWDGRKDSLWSQALEPLENPLEHAISRLQVIQLVIEDAKYREKYEHLFGEIPKVLNGINKTTKENEKKINTFYANIGKVIAAYERKLVPGKSSLDQYIENVVSKKNTKNSELTYDAILGLKLFIGKAQCVNCHNGPLLTNNEFHNNGVPSIANQHPSYGRSTAVWLAIADNFNCYGAYSDAERNDCQELIYTKKSGHELIGAHKVPSLRNVSLTAPYMHAGQFSTLSEVIEHYDKAPKAAVGENELKSLFLSSREKDQLTSFLHSLISPINADQKWLGPPTGFNN